MKCDSKSGSGRWKVKVESDCESGRQKWKAKVKVKSSLFGGLYSLLSSEVCFLDSAIQYLIWEQWKLETWRPGLKLKSESYDWKQLRYSESEKGKVNSESLIGKDSHGLRPGSNLGRGQPRVARILRTGSKTGHHWKYICGTLIISQKNQQHLLDCSPGRWGCQAIHRCLCQGCRLGRGRTGARCERPVSRSLHRVGQEVFDQQLFCVTSTNQGERREREGIGAGFGSRGSWRQKGQESGCCGVGLQIQGENSKSISSFWRRIQCREESVFSKKGQIYLTSAKRGSAWICLASSCHRWKWGQWWRIGSWIQMNSIWGFCMFGFFHMCHHCAVQRPAQCLGFAGAALPSHRVKLPPEGRER